MEIKKNNGLEHNWYALLACILKEKKASQAISEMGVVFYTPLKRKKKRKKVVQACKLLEQPNINI